MGRGVVIRGGNGIVMVSVLLKRYSTLYITVQSLLL